MPYGEYEVDCNKERVELILAQMFKISDEKIKNRDMYFFKDIVDGTLSIRWDPKTLKDYHADLKSVVYAMVDFINGSYTPLIKDTCFMAALLMYLEKGEDYQKINKSLISAGVTEGAEDDYYAAYLTIGNIPNFLDKYDEIIYTTRPFISEADLGYPVNAKPKKEEPIPTPIRKKDEPIEEAPKKKHKKFSLWDDDLNKEEEHETVNSHDIDGVLYDEKVDESGETYLVKHYSDDPETLSAYEEFKGMQLYSEMFGTKVRFYPY